MEYKYITENNLENVQNYMYAQYGGLEFLEAYLQTRRPFFTQDGKDPSALLRAAFSRGGAEPANTTARLLNLLETLDTDSADRAAIDRFIQRFEVRKRLFGEYDPQAGRPVPSSGYANIQNYILLAAIAEKSYCCFHSLKYLSCLLKLDDTLLSLTSDMDDQQLSLVKLLVTREVRHVTEVARRKNVALKEE